MATIQHAHCENNFCADLLAKEGYNLAELFSLFSFPPHFAVSQLSQLLADIWEVSYPHML